ncbi:FkbM family methyltransferase [Planctomicrobium sp. SH664]|uniref:FkbM family methyltransferase n=1 Tax=Planctomicrobium sp. SH664 TaxID=3448125 RepID=UPI003F5B353D
MTWIGSQLKRLLLDGHILWHYGTLHPRRVQLVRSERHLFVNPHDARGRRKLIAGTARGKFPRNQRFYRFAVQLLQPDLVLDVGLNYGECLFSLEYPAATRLFGFEANAGLREFVEASRLEHPNCEQIELLFQLVTDGDTGSEAFFIDKKWSGGSTAGLDPQSYDRTRYELVQVPKGSIDSALQSRQVQFEKLFFKIDVEGYEPNVFAGMRTTLVDAQEAVGFIEFSIPMLTRAGFDVAAYWDLLQSRFDVYTFDRQDRIHPFRGKTLMQLNELCKGHGHTDLLLIRSERPELVGTMLSRWHSSASETD